MYCMQNGHAKSLCDKLQSDVAERTIDQGHRCRCLLTKDQIWGNIDWQYIFVKFSSMWCLKVLC